MSYRTLMSDLAAFYLGRELPELAFSYQEYRKAIVRTRSGRSRLTMPTGIGGRSASRNSRTRPMPPAIGKAETRIAARGVGSGSTQRPATPCSPTPGLGA